MSSIDHLKIAAAELVRAASQKRQEAKDVRNQTFGLKSITDDQVRRLNLQLSARQSELSHVQDSGQRDTVRKSIADLQTLITMRLREHDKERDRAEQIAKAMENQAYDLEAQARSVEQRISAMS